MADRHPEPDSPELRARWGSFALRGMKIAAAVPVVVLMVAFAKVAQYSAVDAFGARLGVDLASLLGAGPVIALYYFTAVKLPALNRFGLSRG